ncbi:hypothetical protein COO60DRAFT_238417 [Scenedesmus sp. NREL 46B-D3]|nr:hypothetical protein COO60DRAFT_238417 [Scenedesmus sp. NREL 46B-D3]
MRSCSSSLPVSCSKLVAMVQQRLLLYVTTNALACVHPARQLQQQACLLAQAGLAAPSRCLPVPLASSAIWSPACSCSTRITVSSRCSSLGASLACLASSFRALHAMPLIQGRCIYLNAAGLCWRGTVAVAVTITAAVVSHAPSPENGVGGA